MSADWERIARLHKQGFSAAHIARVVGCATRTVQRWRNREGLSLPTPPTWSTSVSPERLARAAEMLADGCPKKEVARTLGMHQDTLTRHFPGTAWTALESARFAGQMKALRNMKATLA